MPHIARLSVTPVKGTALHHPEAINLGLHGLDQNRAFYLVDPAGQMANGKRFGSLVQIRADYDPDAQTLSLSTPSGESLTETIEVTGEKTETNFYGRPVRGSYVNGRLAEFISNHVGARLRLVRADEPGAGVDVHPVTLISNATADLIRDEAGAPPEAWRDRFRIMLELDGLSPFEEESWVDRSVSAGEAALSIVGPVPRCVVTTQNPRTGERDFETLAALHRLRGEISRTLSTPTAHLPDGGRLVLGVYATVQVPGVVRRGDPVQLVG